jgi:hypothetical protein
MANPNWIKGVSGNPFGRPKSPEREELRKALEYAQKTQDKSFLQHFVNRAFENDAVAIALAKKLLPDLEEKDLTPDTLSALMAVIAKAKGV